MNEIVNEFDSIVSKLSIDKYQIIKKEAEYYYLYSLFLENMELEV